MDGVRWLFFDIGSTLVDETKVYDDIFQKIAVAAGVSAEHVKTRALEFYRQNKRGHREVMCLLGVEYPEWSPLYEELYPDAVKCLQNLKKKYHLGIIANQIPGAEKRLEEMGIRRYFDLIVTSAEEGVAKPDLRIFRIALARADCTPEQAVMIGDRIDNDIVLFQQCMIQISQYHPDHNDPPDSNKAGICRKYFRIWITALTNNLPHIRESHNRPEYSSTFRLLV